MGLKLEAMQLILVNVGLIYRLHIAADNQGSDIVNNTQPFPACSPTLRYAILKAYDYTYSSPYALLQHYRPLTVPSL